MLPNFFVVGAQKSGTTSLHHYLAEHPDIYLPAQKETKFFVEDERYSKGIAHYESAYFSEWKGEKAVGEVDPDYMYFEAAIERIAEHFRSPKFIFVFRNPIDRAFSSYLMAYRRGFEKYSFEEALLREEERINLGYFENLNFSYVQRGFYYSQVRRFLEKWDISQMRFFLAEDLMNTPQKVIASCYNFLGVAEDFVPPNIGNKFHQATIPRSPRLLELVQEQKALRSIKQIARLLAPKLEWRTWIRSRLYAWNQKPNNLRLKEETRHQLAGIFREENRKLAQLINRDLDYWS